jgi:ABC-2 type transport system ATP-binding protein
MAVIETQSLTKYYGQVKGIENLDLSIEAGEIFGFLGPNGSGKTTTIRLLLDLLHPTRGRAQVLSRDSHRQSLAIRRDLGYIPGEVVLYDGMTAREYLSLMGSFRNGYPPERVKSLAERLDIDLNRSNRAYSRGNKQKVAIIQAFASDPALYVLDEPTSGLDPLVQRQFYDLLLEEKARGKTVFFSSHILPEVERVCDRVGIVRSGNLVAIETVANLKCKKVRRMHLTLGREMAPEEVKLEGADIVSFKGRQLELRVHGNIARLLQQLGQLPVEDLSFPEASLEDTFMQYYGEARP